MLSSSSSVLVTGAAGFIGFHLCCRLLEQQIPVIGIDNLNSYYEPSLKLARVRRLKRLSEEIRVCFDFVRADIENLQALEAVFTGISPFGEALSSGPPRLVVNLAAQAGVRYSIENPSIYIQANLVGFGNILECCRRFNVQHLVFASSSSVYGGNTSLPFSEQQAVDHPVSLYAASKKANELMAHSYSHLYGIPATGLRFFTVYGPWGRPDMAMFLFTRAILEGRPIKVFNHGQMIRDFTYVDDVIECLFRVLKKPATTCATFDPGLPTPDPSTSWAPYRIFNIGNSSPMPLMAYVEAIEDVLGIPAIKEFLPLQPEDVISTAADTSALEAWIDFKPSTPVREGVERFVHWFLDYYQY
jgi:UDP-glucuronate 4-epimerase